MLKRDYSSLFGDLRLEKRGIQFMDRLFSSGTRSIQKLSVTRAEQKAFYNLLKSRKVSEEVLTGELRKRCKQLAEGKVVLSIQDTTEINLTAHSNRINKDTGIGNIGSFSFGQMGFYMHPSLVVDAENFFPLGFSDLHIWNRSFGTESKQDRGYKRQPIEEKESYRWISASQKSKECLESAEAVIIVQDREGDIFEQLERVPDKKSFLLIRSSENRRLEGGGLLWDGFNQVPAAGSYKILINNEMPREAEVEVRYMKATLKPPKNKRESKPCAIYAVEAKEVNSPSSSPVLWRLITSWPVEDFNDALLIIQWYSCRWVIEEVFRMVKKEGFDIESSELESAMAIRKLGIMLLDTVLKLLQMHIAYNMPEELGPPVETCFSEEEIVCLKSLNTSLQGKTVKLSNPYQQDKLKWAVWVIARSGGWKGYTSQQPPGMTTLFHGIQKFTNIMQGWTLLKDMGTR